MPDRARATLAVMDTDPVALPGPGTPLTSLEVLRGYWPEWYIVWDYRVRRYRATRGPVVLEAPDMDAMWREIRRAVAGG